MKMLMKCGKYFTSPLVPVGLPINFHKMTMPSNVQKSFSERRGRFNHQNPIWVP